MLHRVIIASETVGSTGASVLSIAQILGISERNNRRDEITSGVLFHDGWCLHAMEGRRGDLDRLLRRLREDRRLENIRVLSDRPITSRRFCHPMVLADDPVGLLKLVGCPDLAEITSFDVERMLDFKLAA